MYLGIRTGGDKVLSHHTKQLVDQGNGEGLMTEGRHAVPRAVEGVRHGRAQHVVQVHLRHLRHALF